MPVELDEQLFEAENGAASRPPPSVPEDRWTQLLGVNLRAEFGTFVPTLDECPFFLRSALRTALTQALSRLRAGYNVRSA